MFLFILFNDMTSTSRRAWQTFIFTHFKKMSLMICVNGCQSGIFILFCKVWDRRTLLSAIIFVNVDKSRLRFSRVVFSSPFCLWYSDSFDIICLSRRSCLLTPVLSTTYEETLIMIFVPSLFDFSKIDSFLFSYR